MTAHQITATPAGTSWRYAAYGLEETHPTDALCRICRTLVANGFSGPAEVLDASGRVTMTVRSIDHMATLTLTEGDGGLRYAKWRPFDASRFSDAPAADVGRAA